MQDDEVRMIAYMCEMINFSYKMDTYKAKGNFEDTKFLSVWQNYFIHKNLHTELIEKIINAGRLIPEAKQVIVQFIITDFVANKTTNEDEIDLALIEKGIAPILVHNKDREFMGLPPLKI